MLVEWQKYYKKDQLAGQVRLREREGERERERERDGVREKEIMIEQERGTENREGER